MSIVITQIVDGQERSETVGFETAFTSDPLAQYVSVTGSGIEGAEGMESVEWYQVGDTMYMAVGPDEWVSLPASEGEDLSAGLVTPDALLDDTCGWQSQGGKRDQPTVQEALEVALSRVLDEPVRITGAGRTDAGVHARGQVAHLRTENPLALRSLLRGVNTELRRDIAVREIREVPAHFDARRSALRRHYRYLIWNAPEPSPLRARFAAHPGVIQ